MTWDYFDKVASVVSGLLALAAAILAVRRHLRGRRGRGWWAALSPLWRAQSEEAIVHPHRIAGGYVRPLSEVYVARRVVSRLDPAVGPVAAESLLTGSGHVLLIGEPGSGKSALVRQACASSARWWLAGRGRLRRTPPGPVVVGLPATALVHQPLPAALAEAYRDMVPGLDFAREPAPDRAWLVCVDGVDAVADPDDRAEVLNRLAALARAPAPPAGPWRVLVTTRQLAENELAVLGPGYAAYHLTPFTDPDVGRFAHRWFPSAVAARRFLSWVDHQRARPALRNPLTATIAAAVWQAGLAGPDPVADPAVLLDRFVGALLGGGRASFDTTCDTLRRAVRGGPVADWLTERHTELVEVAAAATVTGVDPVAAVVDWSAGQAPYQPDRVLPDWDRHVRQVLLATGLFSDAGAGRVPAARSGAAGGPAPASGTLAATWPGLVEHLAAGPLARDWSAQRWITAMTSTPQRGVGLWAMSRATVAPGFLQDVARDPAGAVAAGHYLAAGGAAGPAVRSDVLAALLTHWSPRPGPAVDGVDPLPVRDVRQECFALLTTLTAATVNRDLLREVAVDPRRPTVVRRAAALFFATRRRQQPAGAARADSGN
ncbi:hypothetical protein OG559_02195 [Micromonospora sp. NBC_01405]|uniref:NACHT domain-containing protein n=1 Tax=Micromonospora sp. NBC_01405 TaxID=2903589 RepID=UPI003255FCD3